MHICAEVMYDGPDGYVHSDICLETGDEDTRGVAEFFAYREFLHANLDEWLDKSNGTGLFYIGDPIWEDGQPDD